MLRCGAFSRDGPPEPFPEPATDATPGVVALLRLRRRRAERLVPLPVPAVVVLDPLLPAPSERPESAPSALPFRPAPGADDR